MLTKRDEIIDELCRDADFKRLCKKIAADAIKGEDLYSEVMLVILQLNNDTVESIYAQSKSNFKKYICFIAYKMFSNKYSAFNKKYNRHNTISIDNIEIEQEQPIDIERLSDALNKRIKFINESYKNDFPYDLKMMEVYLKYSSLRKMSAATGIPYSTCYKSIKRLQKKITDAVNVEDYIN